MLSRAVVAASVGGGGGVEITVGGACDPVFLLACADSVGALFGCFGLQRVQQSSARLVSASGRRERPLVS